MTLALTYDRENRLITVNNGTITITNTYDAFNRLVERASTNRTRFIYDNQWRVIAEYDGNEMLLGKYVYGPEIDEPVKVTRNSSRFYYHQAALGTVTELTGAVGNVRERYFYDVYGAVRMTDQNTNTVTTSVIGNRFLFQGRDRDPATGLYNFRNRYYSPTLGRFLQTDPIRQRGGLNIYGFVGNSPILYTDLLGLSWWEKLKQILWPLFYRPPGGTPPPATSEPNPSGGGLVGDACVGGYYGVGGTAGTQVVRLDDGQQATYLYCGVGLGTPGVSVACQGGRVFDVHRPSDYEGPFINISGGAFGAGGSYSFWPGGSSSVTAGLATPGVSVSFQYYTQPPPLFWYPPYSMRPVPAISLPHDF